MRFRILCLLLTGSALSLAWQTSYIPIVRSIRVQFIQTSSEPPPAIGVETILEALKKVGLAVEQRLDSSKLNKAVDVIQSLYGNAGRKVRVEHSVGSIPPRSLEVTFDVTELCTCK